MSNSMLFDALWQCSLQGIKLDAGKKILDAKFTWNKFGLRDPSFVLDRHGNLVRHDGQWVFFFNGRDKAFQEGSLTKVGMARLTPEGVWAALPEPVFSDGWYTMQGSVLKLPDGRYLMYYSPDTKKGFKIAVSSDLSSWEVFNDNLILTPDQFTCRLMGLPFVTMFENKFSMVFEGTSKKHNRFGIYMAMSDNGFDWLPCNDGNPVYPPQEDGWDAFAQANPSIYSEKDILGNTQYYILYNGCNKVSAWDLGILKADTLAGPWQGAPHPFLERKQLDNDAEGRIEGCRAIPQLNSLFYFYLPSGDSFANGVILSTDLTPSTLQRPGNKMQREIAKLNTLAENIAAEKRYNANVSKKYFAVWDTFPIQKYTAEIEQEILDRHIDKQSKVCVLGSGGGRELPVLLDKQCDITAVDISPDMLAIGQQRFSGEAITWLESDLHDLPLHLQGMDAAICIGAVFNYLYDPELALQNFRRILKNNAILLMSVVNSAHVSEAGSQEFLNGKYRRLYSLSEMEELLRANGFEPILSSGIRFLVDMLPASWGQPASATEQQMQIVQKLLELEKEMLEMMPADRAKFINIVAKAV